MNAWCEAWIYDSDGETVKGCDGGFGHEDDHYYMDSWNGVEVKVSWART